MYQLTILVVVSFVGLGIVEPQVFIHCSDEAFKAELESLMGDETLKREPELSNGVDDLRFVLMVSKVSLVNGWHVVVCGRGGRGGEKVHHPLFV